MSTAKSDNLTGKGAATSDEGMAAVAQDSQLAGFDRGAWFDAVLCDESCNPDLVPPALAKDRAREGVIGANHGVQQVRGNDGGALPRLQFPAVRWMCLRVLYLERKVRCPMAMRKSGFKSNLKKRDPIDVLRFAPGYRFRQVRGTTILAPDELEMHSEVSPVPPPPPMGGNEDVPLVGGGQGRPGWTASPDEGLDEGSPRLRLVAVTVGAPRGTCPL